MKKTVDIVVMADMIDAFDLEQPNPGRQTTAFIKRWRLEELKREHISPSHLQLAVDSINSSEIDVIRRLKKFRDDQKLITKARRWPSTLADCAEVL